MFISANTVIIAGGTLGSTEILLRSKEKGLDVSTNLGKHFTGNGDALGFAYNCEEEINGIGLGININNNIAPVGPCITSIIDMRYQPKLKDGMTFEEGTVPSPLAGIVNNAMPIIAGASEYDTDNSLIDKKKKKEREIISFLKGPYYGATNNMQTFLIMSHDDGNGQINLKNGQLNVDWQGVGQQPIFKKASNAMLDATKALKGIYIKDMVWNKFLNYKLVTVHPLGGCCMGEDGTNGVTDHIGNVFRGNTNSTYSGLYVLDGSIIPMPLGTNPSFTISAVTERACKLIAINMNRKINYNVPHINLPDLKISPAVQFTETMKGFFSINEHVDFEIGFGKGQKEFSSFAYTLTNNNARNIVDAVHNYNGRLIGTVIAPKLSDKPLMVNNALFKSPVTDVDNSSQLRMNYEMQLNSYDGNSFYFYGYKLIENNEIIELWHNTSTLFFTIFQGSDSSGSVLGKGLLKINDADFEIQIGTIKAINCANLSEEIQELNAFSKCFKEK